MWISLGGYLFELGFKLGFCTKAIKSFKNKEVWKGVLGDLIYSSKNNTDKLGFLRKIFESENEEDLYLLFLYEENDENEKENGNKNKKKSFLEGLKEKGFISQEDELKRKNERIQMGIYATGFYGGYLFAKKFAGRKVTPEVFNIFSESAAGGFTNADIILSIDEDKELHVYDLKLFGGWGHIEKFLQEKEDVEGVYIPPRVKGIQLSLAFGEPSLKKFVESLIYAAKVMVEKEEIDLDFEIKSLVQVFYYLFDFLRNYPDKKYEVIKIGIINSTTDGPLFTFRYEPLDFERIAEELESIYKKIKNKTEKYILQLRNELTTVNKEVLKKRLKRLKEILIKEIEEYSKEINARNERDIALRIIPEKSISELRKEVYKRIKDFWKDPWGKALVLLHSTGSGKTTSARRVILEEGNEKVIYLYFAPRIKLLEAEKNEAEKIKGVKTIFVHEKKERKDNVRFRKAGDITESIDNIEANLKIAVREISQNLNKYQKIACFITTHSITKVPYSRVKEKGTLRYISENIGRWIRAGYKVIFVIDELTGSPNGIGSLKEIIGLVKKFKKNTSLLVFDATLHSKGVFERVWNEFSHYGYISPSFVLVDFERDGKLELDGVEAYVYSGYSYPAREIDIKEQFITDIKGKEDMYEKIVDFLEKEVKGSKEKGEKVYIYIQSRNAVSEIARKLEGRDISVFISTSNIRGSQEELEKEDFKYDCVISTSTLSRGISLKQNFTKAILVSTHFFGIEENACEDIQASARIRGTKGEEGKVKEIIRLYTFLEGENRQLIKERARTYVEAFMEDAGINNEEDVSEIEKEIEEIIELIYRRDILKSQLMLADINLKLYKSYYSPEKTVLVAIPRQMKPVFTPEELTPSESAVSFLQEVRDYLKIDENKKRILTDLIELIKDMVYSIPFVNIEEKLKENSIYSVHPYMFVYIDMYSSIKKDKVEACLEKLKKIKEFLYSQNYATTKRIENWLKGLMSGGKKRSLLPALVYIPSVAIAYEVIDNDFVSVDLKFSKYITRFFIRVLGAELEPKANIRRDLYGNGVYGIAFPIENSEVFGWLEGSYPKIGIDLLNAMSELGT